MIVEGDGTQEVLREVLGASAIHAQPATPEIRAVELRLSATLRILHPHDRLYARLVVLVLRACQCSSWHIEWEHVSLCTTKTSRLNNIQAVFEKWLVISSS